MSRIFSSTADHLDAATASVTGYPITISGWYKIPTLGIVTARTLMTVGTSGGNLNCVRGFASASTDKIGSQATDGAASSTAVAVSNTPDSNWHLGVFIFTSAILRFCDMDAVTGVSNVTSRAPTAFNAMSIGSQVSGVGQGWIGSLAYMGLWNMALSDADCLVLLSRKPRFVQPDNLIDCWELVNNQSPEPSIGTAATNMIVTGTTFSSDNPAFAPLVGRVGSFIGVMP